MLPMKQRGALLTQQRIGGYISRPYGGVAQSCGRLGATAPTRCDGEASDIGLFYVHKRSREMLPLKGDTGTAWPR